MYVIRLKTQAESRVYFFTGICNGFFGLTDDISKALLFPCKASVHAMLSLIDSICYNLEPRYCDKMVVDLEEFDEVDEDIFFNYDYEII